MADITNSNLFEETSGIPFRDACVVIVRTDWNAKTVDELEKGCKRILKNYGISDIVSLSVPGAVEIPFAIRQYWLLSNESARPQAFIALGCVIRGGTPHFEYVCRTVTDGITHLNLELPVPTIFGVLTVDDQQQADDRIGGSHGHKGEEAAITAIKMIALVGNISQQKTRGPS